MGTGDLEMMKERKGAEKQRRGLEMIAQSNKDKARTEIYRDYPLYQASKNGSPGDFGEALSQISAAEGRSVDDILSTVSPAGNTFLHSAVKHGNEDAVAFIANKYPVLVLRHNPNGETALHLAAKSGNRSIVTALLQIRLPPQAADENNLLRAKNKSGNTALHEALICGWDWIAQDMIKKDPELSCCTNNKGESAFYLAAKAGFVNCIIPILDGLTLSSSSLDEYLKANFPIQAAIEGKRGGVVQLMISRIPSIIQSRDDQGRTPLHYASSLGYLEGVQDLLNGHAASSNERDGNGCFPIHLASMGGHLDIVILLLKYCLDPEEMLDYNGRNILHVAAENGRYNVVSYILNEPCLQGLINMKDTQGNAPLHLATMHWHPKIVRALTWDNRVDIELVNDKGMTALDVAESYMSNNPPFRQRLTWTALVSAGAPRSMSPKTIEGQSSTDPSNMENYKERVNTLLLVATLVATITFAAGFTMPGGYNSSDTELGMATMLREKAFHLFVFCDAIAMYSSIVVVVSLVWAQLGDLTLVINALTWALPLLGIALSMMSMAFMAGVFVVVSKLMWLSTVVLVIGITFHVILFVLLLPLCIPFSARNTALRYINYYPYYLVMLATGSDSN